MKHRNALIILTIFLLLLTLLLGQDIQEILALILILSVGLVHGAHDLFLIKKMKKGRFDYLKVSIRYLFIAAVFGILYWIEPVFPVAVFVLFSAYHFGEQHWLANLEKPKASQLVFAFSYGLLIISLLLRLNFQETYTIVLELVSFEISKAILNAMLILAGAGLLISGYFTYNSEFRLRKKLLQEFLILTLLGLVFAKATIIWGFAVYFVFWHSIPSIESQLNYMYGGFSWNRVLAYLKKSFLYWLISIAGIGILFYYLGDQRQMLLSVLLVFIAAFTFPHGLVISRMLREKN